MWPRITSEDRFVVGFVGMGPMNFFEGKGRRDGGSIVFETRGNAVVLPESLGHCQDVY